MPYKDPERYKAYQAAYRAAHREENREYQKRYRQEHGEALREYDRLRYAENREEVRERQAQHYREHREERRRKRRESYRLAPTKARAQHRAYAQANPERFRAYRKAWKRRNPQAVAAANRARRAALKGAPVRDFTAEQWEQMQARHGHRCAYCGKQPAHLTQDHIIPLSKGGSHTAANIVPACRSCNSRKGARGPRRPLQGRLPL